MLLLSTVLSGVAHAAIVNVLSPQVGPPEPGVHGSLSAGGQLALGNLDMSVLQLQGGLRYVGDRHVVLLSASGNRTIISDELRIDQGFAHLRDVWWFSDPWATYTFVQVDHNAFRSMTLRNLVGAGLQRRLWRTDWTEATLGTSVMAEYQILSAEDEDEGLHARNSTFVTLAVASDNATVAATSFYQPRLDDPSNYRLFEELSLTVGITEHVDWTAKLRVERDSHPPEDLEKLDLMTTSGLVASF